MKSDMTVTEEIGNISPFRKIRAHVTKSVDGDEVKILPAIDIMGITFSLEEVRELVALLPAAAQRAGVIAAKLQVELDSITVNVGVPRMVFADAKLPEGHERPVVTPLDNLKDLPDSNIQTSEPSKGPCSACKFSFMEPDDLNLTCGHPSASPYGLHVKKEPPQFYFCKDYEKFEQHPLRNVDGSLKSVNETR